MKTVARVACAAIIAGVATSVVVQKTARADTLIGTQTTTYNGLSGSGTVTIQSDVFNQGADYLWKYTVTNNSFTPANGNGFSGFELALPVGIGGAGDIANITDPGPGWIHDCCSGEPVEWDITNPGTGIVSGTTGVFSFTTLPRSITNSDGWFHTWDMTSNVQTFISNYSDTPGALGPLAPDLLLPPTSAVPLPGALPLFATGLAGLGLLGWRRKRKAQAAA